MLDSSNTLNLRRLLWVRLLLVGVLVPALALLGSALGLHLARAPLMLVVAACIGVTLLSWWWLGRLPGQPGTGAVVAQLGIDIASLTAILYLSGGWTNPLISLYLVPIAVAAATLRAAATWICAGVCVLAYSALTRVYVPMFHIHGNSDPGFALHITGMWLTFVVAAALVAYFGTSMAATLREQDRALLAAREQNLRNEQILGMATLAAGTAHELSTPLASIAVIASELESTSQGQTRAELQQLLTQVDACRDALARLREAAAPASEQQRADLLINELRERFELLRPSVRLVCRQDPPASAPRLTIDNTLRQALLNLLDNAADASPQDVELHGRWLHGRVEIDILDRGPGLAGGQRPSGTGMGMGLLLANASIERAGGSVYAAPREGGGLRIRVRLPVTAAGERAGSAGPGP
ncbi:MAG: ATP-binding protein [Pseudomonadales bacterium]